jgi:YidC/Oxa1 family membrane protein insertase
MEKNTILAVVLSTVVLIGFYVMQGVFNPPRPAAPPAETTAIEPVQSPEPPPTAQSPQMPVQQAQQEAAQQAAAAEDQQLKEYIKIETQLIEVLLTNAGGNVVSWKLKDHFDGEDVIDMIFSGSEEAQAFSIALGGIDAQPLSSIFNVNRISDYSIEFYRDFTTADKTFRLIKRYDFKPNDYMFELTVTLDGGYSTQSFDFNGSAYTLTFGPQIGPKFVKIDRYYDYRMYQIFLNGKLKNAKLNDKIASRPSWAAISGKYFTFIALPYPSQYDIIFSQWARPGLPHPSWLSIVRPAANTSRVTDTYRFYLGPKSHDALAAYNNGKNEFGLLDTNLVEIASSRFLYPLEKILKWFLILFQKVVHNYGVAIIMLTLLIKLIFFPLTKKGSEAMVRMQALTPRIKEIQDKYKNNPQKLQLEMGKFYKENNYNPISGCLPMLLQMPIFIAMYSLFNNHFDLRGAEFIPGWIPDLSLPEFVWESKSGARLPILGWTAFRLLPFIYVGSQLLYSKVTQMPGQQQNPQMKMMLYAMPIIFFFVLYNVPSGLLIYWIFSNLLTMVQQLIINKYVMAKKIHIEEQKPVIAPVKKKKK